MKKGAWLVVSCLMALSLVLASCAPAATEKEEVTPAPEEVTPVPKEVAPAPEEVTPVPAAEKPKNGGTLIVGLDRDVQGFDQTYLGTFWDISTQISYDELLTGDWTRGPAGTGESDFMFSNFAPEGFFRETGAVAESWEIPDDQTIIFHIRKGIHFWNKPPANGREIDANDVAFSIDYMYNNRDIPVTYGVSSSSNSMKVFPAKVTDKWTVEVKVEGLAPALFESVASMLNIVPRESIEKYGNLRDWRNALGSGPFMVTDYVAGSSLTFVKNPNYWMKDPIGAGKGNQLPYLNNIKALVLEDKSTQYAAFRTGKIDQIQGVYAPQWEDIEIFLKTNPETKYKERFQNMLSMGVRVSSADPLATPLKNKRIRQALNMAIDKAEIVRDYYGGKSVERALFFRPGDLYYSTNDKMVEILEKEFGFKPEEAIMVKKMQEYHPEEARKILAEEGYPNGFKTEVVTRAAYIDQASIIQGYWKKNLNVDLAIDVREPAVYSSIANSKATKAFFLQPEFTIGVGAERWSGYGVRTHIGNRWDNEDPRLISLRDRMYEVYGDIEARNKALQNSEAYIMELALSVLIPMPYQYYVWQPWLKNYNGEGYLGYKNTYLWARHVWYDQELKTQMGYR